MSRAWILLTTVACGVVSVPPGLVDLDAGSDEIEDSGLEEPDSPGPGTPDAAPDSSAAGRPWFVEPYTYDETQGFTWELGELQFDVEQHGVPRLLVLPAGKFRLLIGTQSGIRVAESSDGGESWNMTDGIIALTDPDITLLYTKDDGYRILYALGFPGERVLRSAFSVDGTGDFSLEESDRFVPEDGELMDPCVAWVDDSTWRLYYTGAEQKIYTAISFDDGESFTAEDQEPLLSGMLDLEVVYQAAGGYRFYVRQGENILAFESTDGLLYGEELSVWLPFAPKSVSFAKIGGKPFAFFPQASDLTIGTALAQD